MNLSSAAGRPGDDRGRDQVRLPGIWAPAAGSRPPAKTRRTARTTSRRYRLLLQVASSFVGVLTVIAVARLLAGGGNAVTDQAGSATGLPVAGAAPMAVILLVAFFCGGYVASWMTPSSRTRQGLAVWLWGVALAVVLAVLAVVAGARYDVLTRVDLPVDAGTLSAGGVAALVVGLLAGLVGALLGGAAGKRHRR